MIVVISLFGAIGFLIGGFTGAAVGVVLAAIVAIILRIAEG